MAKRMFNRGRARQNDSVDALQSAGCKACTNQPNNLLATHN